MIKYIIKLITYEDDNNIYWSSEKNFNTFLHVKRFDLEVEAYEAIYTELPDGIFQVLPIVDKNTENLLMF